MAINIQADKTITSVFDSFKKITPALIAVAIVSGSILFLPEKMLKKMGLNNIPEGIRRIIGITFLLSAALIIVILAYSIIDPIVSKKRNRKLLSILRDNLIKLSDERKEILVYILNSPTKAQNLDAQDGDIRYLESKNFICKASSYTFTGPGMRLIFPYNVQAWVMDLYEKEPELFENK